MLQSEVTRLRHQTDVTNSNAGLEKVINATADPLMKEKMQLGHYAAGLQAHMALLGHPAAGCPGSPGGGKVPGGEADHTNMIMNMVTNTSASSGAASSSTSNLYLEQKAPDVHYEAELRKRKIV